MTKITYLWMALLAAALLGCAVLAYLWVDRSISLSYARQSAETSDNSIRHLERLLEEEWRGMPEAKVLQKLQNAAARVPAEKVVIKNEEGIIWFDEVRFNLVHGQLNSIGEPNGNSGNESPEHP